jgi:raffinose/stachyose/melibiose transport system substrate-binding protein
MRRAWELVKTWIPVAVGVGAFVWSAVYITMHRIEQAQPGTIVLRIGHWQLETGVREAFDQLARDYQTINPKVRVVQDPIPESTYGQWVTTQLMGKTAPDMMEVGLGLQWYLWSAYLHRYFIPLSRVYDQPNPYNLGTPLEGVSLRNTYLDGGRGGYWENLQEFMTIGLAQFGVRIFYNRDLLKKLTGLEECPRDYRGFVAACEKIRSQALPGGKPYVAIAGSSYHTWMWELFMCDLMTNPALELSDFNRDGLVDQNEHYVAFRNGMIGFDFPPYRARFRMFREISDQFQTGYIGLSRDEAVFLFAQKKAVFLPTGTWDARLLEAQARESGFTVGVAEFPLPGTDDPDYGKFVRGPLYERPQTGFPFGITRTSKYPEVAQDFLLFLAAYRQNQKLNDIIGWIPAIKGVEMASILKAFVPHFSGVQGCMNFGIGGNSSIKWMQDYAMFQARKIDYDQLAASFAPYYREHGLEDYQEAQRVWRRGIWSDEQFLSGIRGTALNKTGQESEGAWVKYRALTASRLVFPEIAHAREAKLVTRGPEPGAVGPYIHTPRALARLGGK